MARRLDILFAAEYLLPPNGGAEMWALEALGALSERHATRAVWIDGGKPAPWRTPQLPAGVEGVQATAPADAGGYWRAKKARGRALGAAVTGEVARRRPDVLLTQLHGAPAAIEAAGAPAVVGLPSYESLCKHAFHPGSDCAPGRDCASCPAAARVAGAERAAMLASRAAQAGALERAAEVVAAGPAVARACEEWTGRKPVVVPPVVAPPPVPSPPPAADGHALLSCARWSTQKGADLLAPLAEALAPRRVLITPEGLGDRRAALERLPNVGLVGAPTSELLGGAAVLLMPSRWPEPFGRVAFEALAAGVPVVASAVGSLPWFVPSEGLVDPDAPAAEWAARAASLTEAARFDSAAQRAREAAGAVLRQRPLATLERTLVEAARAASTPHAPAPARSPR